MPAPNEKTPSGENRSADESRSGGRKWVSFAIVIGLAIGIAMLIYVLASTGGGKVAEIPRGSFEAAELAAARQALEERAVGFRPAVEETAAIELVHQIHRAESRSPQSPEWAAEVEQLIKAFSERARAMAANDRQRYLVLGDVLALEFDRELARALDAARAGGLEALEDAGGPDSDLERAGGAFLRRAMESGLIDQAAVLRAPKLLPQVLFRVRWRALAGLSHRVDIDPVEWRANMDFVIAFSRSSSVEIRLQAIGELADLDSSYDADLARAIVYHEAGRDAESYSILKAAIDSGRKDEALTEFARLLAP